MSTSNPETPLEIAKEWEAELSVMASGLDETIRVKASDIRALARAVIEAEGRRLRESNFGQGTIAYSNGAEHGAETVRARIVTAIRSMPGVLCHLAPNELADWIERGCPDWPYPSAANLKLALDCVESEAVRLRAEQEGGYVCMADGTCLFPHGHQGPHARDINAAVAQARRDALTEAADDLDAMNAEEINVANGSTIMRIAKWLRARAAEVKP